jgi:dTDP-4-dehydrorhamnose 3,5-epimerase
MLLINSWNMQAQAKQYDLDGIQVVDINKNPDERGFFAEAARKDWLDIFGEKWISQANLSQSYPGIIRAWHRHAKGQVDYFMVLQGAMKIVAYDGNGNSKTYCKIVEIVASEERLQIVKIPGHYWHGTKTIGNKPSITVYFVNNLYDYGIPDEERRPWDDSSIVDPKTRQPYDWNRPPHK